MSEKRMMVIEADVMAKIDANRGEMSRSEFLNFLIDSQLNEGTATAGTNHKYVDREEFMQFTQGMKDLLRNFLDFFISYGMELGEQPKDSSFQELVNKLQVISASGSKIKPPSKD
jgi:hypothetical protein